MSSLSKVNNCIFTAYYFNIKCLSTSWFWHRRLNLLKLLGLNKLIKLGIRELLLSWLSSYLSGWLQQIKTNNVISDTFNISSSVLQGQYLSPLLFLIFINDISQYLDIMRFYCLQLGCIAWWSKFHRSY